MLFFPFGLGRVSKKGKCKRQRAGRESEREGDRQIEMDR